MSTHTYELAVALQAMAIESIDRHNVGVHTPPHSFGDDITVVARHRITTGKQMLQMWARDRDAHLLGSAEASTSLGGGVITSHVTAFRSAHVRWERRVIPTKQQYRNPAELACGSLTAHPERVQIGFHAYGRADYYLAHDWAPGRSPWRTTWSLLVGTARAGLVHACTGVSIDTAVEYATDLDSRHLTPV